MKQLLTIFTLHTYGSLKKFSQSEEWLKKISATDCMTLSTLMLVSHPYILMINIIEGTPDPEIGS